MKLEKEYMINLALHGLEAGTKESVADGTEAGQTQIAENAAGQQKKIIQIEPKQAIETLKKYKAGKEQLENRIKENENWYRMRHWEHIKKAENDKLVVEGKSAWLFNSLLNKHADYMDNMPEPNILPREPQDIEEAKKLSTIVPLVFENVDFESTYDEVVWDKIKNGVGVYGIFWDKTAENGLGDICIKEVDLLNIYWEPGISDIQDSRNLFIVSLEDREVIKRQYNLTELDSGSAIDVSKYALEDDIDTAWKVLVIDWYFKDTDEAGNKVLHFVKLAGETILYNSIDAGLETLYDHALYPVVFDTLFPMKGTPAGFGYINIGKDDQEHIDKLDSIILQNAYEGGIPRFWRKSGTGVDDNQYGDFSKRFVDVEGNPNESIQTIEVPQLPAYIFSHRQNKIDEMKETTSNRDVSSGGAAGGVTAAAAISALQEAGNKTSRDMIKASYRTYTKIVKMVIELIRQFYDEPRQFRITGENGEETFTTYTNEGLQLQELPQLSGQEQKYRRAYFDIKVKAQKANPYSRVSQNELACNLYSMGAFNPSRAVEIIPAINMMEFEGKDKVLQAIKENANIMQNMVQYVQAYMQGQQVSQPGPQATMNMENDKSYAEKIADRAKPNMEEGAN